MDLGDCLLNNILPTPSGYLLYPDTGKSSKTTTGFGRLLWVVCWLHKVLWSRRGRSIELSQFWG